MNCYISALKWRRVAAPAVAVLILGACTSALSQPKSNAEDSLRRFRVEAQTEIKCQAAAARNPQYQILRGDMPLTDFEAVTLSEMANQNFATNEEISALDAWTNDINVCLQPLLHDTDATVASIGPIIEASWNDNNAVFVKLVHHQMRWGETVTRLKGDRIKLRADVIARADKVSEELGKLQMAQFNRNTAIITAAIGILP